MGLALFREKCHAPTHGERDEAGFSQVFLSWPTERKQRLSSFHLSAPERSFFMSSHAILSPVRNHSAADAGQLPERSQHFRHPQLSARRNSPAPFPIHFPAQAAMEEGTYRQAELFYLQKQIQAQTPMVIVMEDGEQVEGCIEWYDRNCLKVRGRNKTLVYKSAIKYMYKLGEQGQ
jgi:sRNA-binding regulator protein Hfq